MTRIAQDLLKEKISQIEGVIEVKPDIVNKNLFISYIPTVIAENKILSDIKTLGIKVKKYVDAISDYEEKRKSLQNLKGI